MISNLRDEELSHFFHVPILTKNIYWKLLKYKLTMLILTQNMQIFIELWYESLICVARVGMWETCCWELDPIILLLLLFLSLTGDQLLFQVLMVLKFIYYIWLTLSRELFALICFSEPNFPDILRGFNFARSLLKQRF